MQFPFRNGLGSVAIAALLLALAANTYATHTTRMALRATDQSERLRQYAGNEARLFELGGAVSADNNRRAAAIDAAKSRYRVSQVEAQNELNTPGAVLAYFDGARPVLYESVFPSGRGAVTTRYYLDTESRPFLVVRTTSQAEDADAKRVDTVETTHFVGGIYVMSQVTDSPLTRVTEQRGVAPESAARLLEEAARFGALLDQ